VRPLDPAREAALRAASPTWTAATGTDGPPVPGYAVLRRTHVVGRGEECLRAASELVLTWGMHEGAGLRVAASAPRAQMGEVVQVTIGLGPIGFKAPCRVTHVVDEPRRKGFTYVTLPGHPEEGVESFEVRMDADGTVHGTVTAYSKPASWLVWAGGPVSRLVQRVAADRYIAAMARACGGQPARRRAR
jgi:uncharacterized protein (UPF0548 family)